MTDDHIPAPSEHSPRKEAMQIASGEFVVYEQGNVDARISSDLTVEVQQ